MYNVIKTLKNNVSPLFYPLIALFLLVNSSFAADTCTSDVNQGCKCKTKDGKEIDLSPLSQGTGRDEPHFKDEKGLKDAVFYSYTPCKSFNEPNPPPSAGAPCQNVQVCQKSNGTYFNLGTQQTATFHGDPSQAGFYIKYTSQMGSQNRTTTIYLECTNSKTSTFKGGEVLLLNYNFTLTSQYACLEQPKSGLSVGSILVIVFFVLLVVYVVGGILYLRFARGARGTEQIPNYAFWSDLPWLVKDGALFLFRGCKAENPGYNQI